MMIYFKMCFKVPYFLSDHAAFAKRYCKNKQNINSLTCFPHTFLYFYKNKQKKYPVATKRYVQWLELESDEEAIREYRKLHSEGVQWKEIRDGIRQVGILEMEIYIFGNRLVMIVDAPEDFDWDKSMAELATLPRQAEWEEVVGKFQKCGKGATSDEKWHMMERIFYLYE